MTALIRVEVCFYRLPAGIPYSITVFYVIIASALIRRDVVVTVTGKAEKFCILVVSVTTAGILNKLKKIAAS